MNAFASHPRRINIVVLELAAVSAAFFGLSVIGAYTVLGWLT